MSSKWISTQYTGVRYRENPDRKHNGKPDRYFAIRYKLNGKQREEALGWASEGWNAQKASLQRADLRKAQKTGEGPQTLEEKRNIENEKRIAKKAEKERIAKELLTFKSYFKDTYSPDAKSDKTKDTYRREQSLFKLWIKPVIGKMPFKDIRPLHLERIKKNMKDAGKAPRSIQYALAVVSQIFTHAFQNEKYNGDNPAKKVRRPKIDNKRVRFLSTDEANSLLVELKSRSQQLHDISLISLHCGLRASEIFKLTWGDIDLGNRIITVRGKGNKTRPALMTTEVEKIFVALSRDAPDKIIFKNSKGGQIGKISNSYGRAVDELKLNKDVSDYRHKVVFHTLRHTYASWLVQNGVDLYTVQKLMGHSTIAMTERYAHLAPDNLKAAVRVLEKSLEKHEDKSKKGGNDKAEALQ